jgi:2-dehydropantoate 2-reductase
VEVDLAIIATKAYDTDRAIETLRKALEDRAGTTILCPQNGVGNEEKIAEAFGADNVMACALTVPIDKARDGSSLAVAAGGIILAPVGRLAHNWLLAVFERMPVPVRVVSDYRSLKWSKLSLNVIANATCAIFDVLPQRLVRLDDAFSLDLLAVREVRTVMRAMGLKAVDLPNYPVRALHLVIGLPFMLARAILAGRVAGARGRKPPSLLLDLRSLRGRTEIDALNGAVVEAGRAYGVETPVNTMLTTVLGEIVRSPQLWEKYRGHPAAFQALLRGARAS